MGHLTDTQHKTVGHTVLYVPDEGRRMADKHAHRDKDLVQRLEGLYLYVFFLQLYKLIYIVYTCEYL